MPRGIVELIETLPESRARLPVSGIPTTTPSRSGYPPASTQPWHKAGIHAANPRPCQLSPSVSNPPCLHFSDSAPFLPLSLSLSFFFLSLSLSLSYVFACLSLCLSFSLSCWPGLDACREPGPAVSAIHAHTHLWTGTLWAEPECVFVCISNLGCS